MGAIENGNARLGEARVGGAPATDWPRELQTLPRAKLIDGYDEVKEVDTAKSNANKAFRDVRGTT
jgi:hypothetical protein